MRQDGVDFVLHYLDDFLLVGAPASQECTGALTTLLSVFDRLGFPVALDKLESPGNQLTSLGFELGVSSTVTYDKEQSASWIPSLTLIPSEDDMAKIRCCLPVEALEITPKSLVCTWGNAAGVKSPRAQPSLHSLAK